MFFSLKFIIWNIFYLGEMDSIVKKIQVELNILKEFLVAYYLMSFWISLKTFSGRSSEIAHIKYISHKKS